MFIKVVGKRLLHYVAASLLSNEHLTQHLNHILEANNEPFQPLVQTFNDPSELVKDLQVKLHAYLKCNNNFYAFHPLL